MTPLDQTSWTAFLAETNPSEVSTLLLTPEEAAQRLRIGRTRVYALLRDGRLRSVTIGRSRRVPLAALAEFIQDLSGASSEIQPTVSDGRPGRDQPGLLEGSVVK